VFAALVEDTRHPKVEVTGWPAGGASSELALVADYLSEDYRRLDHVG
jgi:hypothetical protein